MKPLRSRNLLESFRFAFAGLGYALRTQRNTRIHLTVAALVVALGLWLRLPPAHWAFLALTIGLVLVGEMINTVVETLVDMITSDYHPLAKVTKDVMAAVVLLTAMFSVIVGLLVLGPPLWARLFGTP